MGYGIGRLLVLGAAMAGLAAGSACGHTPGNPGPGPVDLSARQTRAPGEYLVTLVPGADAKVIDDCYGRFGIKSIKDLGRDIFLVILAEDPGPARMEEISGRNARIKAIQPNYRYRTNGPGNAQ